VPGRYSVVVTETSTNIDDEDERLLLHWTCVRDVHPERYNYKIRWTNIEGVAGKRELRAEANCRPGDRLTAQVDAAAESTPASPTKLACQVYTIDGALVVEQRVTRGRGSTDPRCHVDVPGA
jgi:hypothetical protein